ncbi:CHASE3 domain-containing protein [Saccharopolyspora sp. K220]|uniref:CHASE3 domain-containing protein n=1 Tax=Saccharopolyspora soli TaxID=2926618 RepID=UPI001F581808|nr:CHASE3 domain-containing protein [Saccharopolyspora soli]MCI2415948.1 CHASE3 domain-containing protein [Saccharopolyspora soli]
MSWRPRNPSEPQLSAGLTRRMLIASGLLALVIGAAFAVLLASVADLRASERSTRQSEEVVVAANRLERLVVDVEAGERGFLVTGQDDSLALWRSGQAAIPAQAETLQRLVADSPGQLGLARQIQQAANAYIQDYSTPLVETARRDLAAARAQAANGEGVRRIDAIRAEFDRLVTVEQGLEVERQSRSGAAGRRAIAAAATGLAGSILLIVIFAAYLARVIVGPVRRAAAMAGRLASGDLGARLPERGVGEIGVLERSFNTMARSLQSSREELAASRARIVAAADQARRRIERDLHDGVQQRLVSLALELRAAEAAATPELKQRLAGVTSELVGATDDLRELSRGIHPAMLSEGGLPPALRALARRSAVPVELTADIPERPLEQVEVAAYYVVSEALTNAAKHARASVVHVAVWARDDGLHLVVRDDGVGGATTGQGSGLVGLTDRVQALGGTITITSPPGEGTTLVVDLPTEVR